MNDADVYLVWSHEHGGWWGPGRNGYVQKVSDAGRYSRAQALEICCGSVPGTAAQLGAMPELPVRLADVAAIIAAYFETYPIELENRVPWL
jgi:hypothetical protein